MSTPSDPEHPRVDDATWQDIVARLEAADTEADRMNNDGDASFSTDSPSQPGAAGDTLLPPVLPTPVMGSGPRDYVVEEDDEDERYNPEVSMDLETAHPVSVLAWVGLVASVVAVIVILLLRPSSSWWFIGTIVVFLASAGLLLWRLPTQRGDDDNGAQL